jgi:hypothetical protein
MTVLSTLGVVLLMAFLVETLVEAVFGTAAAWVVGFFPSLEGQMGYFKTPVVQTVAFGAGIVGAFLYQFDVIYLLGGFLNAPGVLLTSYGMIATGLAIGKGSNYIHQLISQFFPAK